MITKQIDLGNKIAAKLVRERQELIGITEALDREYESLREHILNQAEGFYSGLLENGDLVPILKTRQTQSIHTGICSGPNQEGNKSDLGVLIRLSRDRLYYYNFGGSIYFTTESELTPKLVAEAYLRFGTRSHPIVTRYDDAFDYELFKLNICRLGSSEEYIVASNLKREIMFMRQLISTTE